MIDKAVVASLMTALLEACEFIAEGNDYKGDEEELIASVKEALRAGAAYLGIEPRTSKRRKTNECLKAKDRKNLTRKSGRTATINPPRLS